MSYKLCLLLLLSTLGSSACGSSSGVRQCDHVTDCAVGLDCNSNAEGTERCALPDGGASDGAAARAGSDDGTAPVVDAAGGQDSEAGGQDEGGGESTDAEAIDASMEVPVDREPNCVTSADCNDDPTKPICDALKGQCVACTSDGQCVTKLGADPGVCMAHEDGRCATDSETIYVRNQAGCSDTGPGTVATPFCSLGDGGFLSVPGDAGSGAGGELIVVRGAVTGASGAIRRSSLVGQLGASITATGGYYGLRVYRGQSLYVRGVSVTAAGSVGIWADGFSDLKLDHVTVTKSQGGVYVGGTFDISNTTITANGPDTIIPFMGWSGIFATGGKLTLVTVSNNQGGGVTCAGPTTGMGVYATGNTVDITPACGFASCPIPGPDCGAQP